MAIEITEKDIGRKVRLRDGSTDTIIKILPQYLYAVVLKNNRAVTYTGYQVAYPYSYGDSKSDVVAFVDEPESTPVNEPETVFPPQQRETAIRVASLLTDILNKVGVSQPTCNLLMDRVTDSLLTEQHHHLLDLVTELAVVNSNVVTKE